MRKDHTMTLRRVLSALFASVLLTGLATSAQAAPAKPRVHHRTMAPHSTTHATRASTRATARSVRTPRGGDAQNSVVDQLNNQSLQRAQTSTPTQ